MKHTRYFLVFWGLLILSVFIVQAVHAQQLMPSRNSTNELISLNGTWKFKLHPTSSIGTDTLFYQSGFETSKWSDIKVPGNWELQGFSKPYYGKVEVDGTGLYVRNFHVPVSWKDNPVYVAFDGVLYGYSVWINGIFTGKFSSAFNRHTFDISKLVKPGMKKYPGSKSG